MAKRIYVGSLPYSVSREQLEELFGQYGDVTDVYIVTDRETGQARGFAFVEMSDDDAALKAVNELNGSQMGGRTLVVNEARDRASGGGGGGSYGGGGGGGGYDRDRGGREQRGGGRRW